ncbi:MAG: hypothetical protein P8101_19080 [Candidatus Thiodiazotropha sp.]
MNTATMPIEPVLLSVTPNLTYHRNTPLTNATGFFFERNDRFLDTPLPRCAFGLDSGHRHCR